MFRPEGVSRLRRAAAARLFAVICGFALLAQAIASAGAAQSPAPLRLKIEPVVARPRSLGPTAIEVLIVCDSSRLFEGHLELSFFLGKETRIRVYEYRSDDLAISAGDHRLKVLVPPVPVTRDLDNLVIHGRFVGRTGVIEFPDEYNVQVGGSHKRQFVIGIAQPVTRVSRNDGLSFADRLPFEQFNRQPEIRSDWLTYPAFIPPAEFPVSSVGYFVFDVLVLEDDGLVELKEPQLRAIADWVEAGGSLLVMITREVQPRHRDFLNRLIPAADEQATFGTDERGQLALLGDERTQPFVQSSPGLGRVAVIYRPIERREFFETYEWKKIVLSLWKARVDQWPAIRTTGGWAPKVLPMQNNYLRPPAFSPVPLANNEKLFELLIPSRVEGIPMRTVVAILALFLLAAAPGDYFLLGFLRRRKYTWVLFTTISLGFTLVTVQLAQSHLGRIDYRTHLTFIDLGASTQPVRSTKIEMVFVAAERKLETPTRDELHLSLNQRRLQTPAALNPRVFDATFDEYPLAVDPDIPLAEGRAVGSYTVHQQMRQWSPRFHRITTCVPTDSLPQIDWDRRPDESLDTSDGRRKYHERVSRQFPEATTLILHATDTYAVSAKGEAITDLATEAQTLVSLIADMSRRPDLGMFSMVSQISPNGADGFEDLAVVDASDAARWWVLLIVPDGLSHTVYRKSFP